VNGSITKKRLKNGRVSWGWYYKLGEQQFTKSGFGTRDEARSALDNALSKDIDATSHKPKADRLVADSRTLSVYLAYWLDNHASLRCAPATMENYRGLAKYLTKGSGSGK
jgi:hypothetical protein